MPDVSQILKGLLEGCILSVVSADETYGYEICRRLAAGGFKDVNQGTVYPILVRLEQKGLLTSVKRDSVLGPKRKYYHLTRKGREVLANFIVEWETIRRAVENCVREVSEDERE